MSDRLETRFFLGLLLLVSALFLWLLTPFFAAVFWALAITIVFYPLHTRLCDKMPHWPNMAAAITLTLCVIIVVIPLIITVNSAISQALEISQKFQQNGTDLQQYFDNLTTNIPWLDSWIDRQNIDVNSLREKALDSAAEGGKYLARGTWALGQTIFSLFIFSGIMLYVMFFLLRDGKHILSGLMKALPLGNDKEQLLFKKLAEVTRATIKGNLVIAIVQGGLGGLIFWAFDIPAAILWGVVMTILSLIPIIGSGLIWGPVAIYMILTGDIWQGITLIIFGIAVIGLVDNFLRPLLVGRDTKMPDYIVLLSTLGGLALFGAHGFVAGPIIAALFITVWGIFMREFQHEDTVNPLTKRY